MIHRYDPGHGSISAELLRFLFPVVSTVHQAITEISDELAVALKSSRASCWLFAELPLAPRFALM